RSRLILTFFIPQVMTALSHGASHICEADASGAAPGQKEARRTKDEGGLDARRGTKAAGQPVTA
ncbi:hypothetical protein KKB44_06770, partial [Candidatus Micrarchaeota archaeon]|nr:hypothetical protein [Candidatus Micrarchaeota archaeon]